MLNSYFGESTQNGLGLDCQVWPMFNSHPGPQPAQQDSRLSFNQICNLLHMGETAGYRSGKTGWPALYEMVRPRSI